MPLSRKYSVIALATAVVLTLTGCGALETSPSPTPQVTAPTIRNVNTLTDAILSTPNTIGVGPLVLTDPLGDIADWTATFDPTGIAEFTPAHTDGTASFNATLSGLTEGKTTLTLRNTVTGAQRTVNVTVTGPAWATQQPVNDMELQAEKTQRFADTLVGLTKTAALTQATEFTEYKVRIVAEDGTSYIVTMDYRTDRINLTLVDGRVTEATVG